jgi:hypothetical protein
MNKPPSGTMRLSPTEIVQRCKDDKCIHCDEFFTSGHKLVCKHLFIIEVIERQ